MVGSEVSPIYLAFKILTRFFIYLLYTCVRVLSSPFNGPHEYLTNPAKTCGILNSPNTTFQSQKNHTQNHMFKYHVF